jgi:REP element-mobilizing transposase RayT
MSGVGEDIGGGGFSPASRRPHWRKSLRNPNINYRNGWFFVTTQVAHNKCILGAIVRDRFVPTPLGEEVRKAWLAIPEKHPEMELGEFAVMPNHFHAIVRVRWRPTNKEHHLGYLVGQFKGGTGFVYGRMRGVHGGAEAPQTDMGRCPDIGPHLWQVDYWDDLISSADELAAQSRYIRDNPANWTRDRFGPCTEYAFGNVELLSAPRIAFVASQGFPAAGMKPRLFWREGGAEAPRADMGEAVIISTFTSAQEREALRRALAQGRRVVAVLPGGIPPESELFPALADACREGRALLVSPQPPRSPLTKKAATWCNEYVLSDADEIWTGDLSEGGMLRAMLQLVTNGGLGKGDGDRGNKGTDKNAG